MMKKDISANLHQKCLIFLHYDSTKCAPQYERNSLVTMATYWVPDLPNRPFARPGHMVQNYIYWLASCTVGLPKQRQVHCLCIVCAFLATFGVPF